MKKNNKHYINISVILLSLAFIIFNEFGIIKLLGIHGEKQKIEQEIQKLIAEQDDLMHEIELLKTDEVYIKKIAREEFHMAAPGEKIYRVKRDRIIE